MRTWSRCRRRQRLAIALAVVDGREQIDAGKAVESLRDRQPLRLGKRIGVLPRNENRPIPVACAACAMTTTLSAITAS